MAALEAPDGATISGQIEIPFIPLNKRQSHLGPISDDTIVVVGQARQKKRKREKSKAMDKPSIGDREDTGEDEAFDYAAVPNLLDDVPPVPEGLGTRKKKKQKDAKGTCPSVFCVLTCDILYHIQIFTKLAREGFLDACVAIPSVP